MTTIERAPAAAVPDPRFLATVARLSTYRQCRNVDRLGRECIADAAGSPDGLCNGCAYTTTAVAS